jgi:thioredoxin-dependent peroxiredoxin
MEQHRLRTVGLAALMLAATAAVGSSQEAPPKPGSAAFAPKVGEMAPDFSLPAVTRYGMLKDPVKLGDYRGQTVVLAFFPKARTKG